MHDIPESMAWVFPVQRGNNAAAIAVSVAARVEALLAAKPEAVLLLPAGSTPIPVFAELARRRVDSSRAWIVQLDELVGVAPDDPRSFHEFLHEHWIRPLGHPIERTLLLDGTAADPHAEIAGHAARLRELGRPDLALLGVGRNGHVAFNEPGTEAEACARVVELAETTRLGMGDVFATAPPHGMTLGLSELGSGLATLLIATGAGKSPILARLFSETPSPALPASLLAHRAGFEVFADKAALGDSSE